MAAEEIALSTLFNAKNEPVSQERVSVAVKILKKKSENFYTIADSMFHCWMKFEDSFDSKDSFGSSYLFMFMAKFLYTNFFNHCI